MSRPHTTLTPSELRLAAWAGIERRMAGMANDWKMKFETPEGPWEAHIEGCCGEVALAKYLNVFWSGTVGVLHAPDVGDLQVRCRRDPNAQLVLRTVTKDHERPEEWYVLVVGSSGRYEIAGCIQCKDGLRDEFYDNRPGLTPAWLVPQRVLKPLPPIWRRSGRFSEMV